MPSYLSRHYGSLLDNLEAAVFTGSIIEDHPEIFREYLGRWSRKLEEFDKAQKAKQTVLIDEDSTADFDKMTKRVELSFFMVFMQNKGFWPHKVRIGEPPVPASAEEAHSLCIAWVDYSEGKRRLVAETNKGGL